MIIWTSKSRRVFIYAHDIVLCIFAWLSAFWFRHNLGVIPRDELIQAIYFAPVIAFIQTLCFYYFKLYRSLWRYVSLDDINHIVQSAMITSLGAAWIIYNLTQFQSVPRSAFPLYVILATAFLSTPRALLRIYRNAKQQSLKEQVVLIVGAGSAGERLLRDLRRYRELPFKVIGFLDDEPYKKGQTIHGVKVLGTCARMSKIVRKHQVQRVFIAIPSASSSQMRHIVKCCEEAAIAFSTLPGLKDLAQGKVTIDALRGVSIEDLLGREEAALVTTDEDSSIHQRVVMITGAGGSIGSELCRQILKLAPAKLIIFDHAEYNLYQIQQELLSIKHKVEIQFVLASVCDPVAVESCMEKHKPEIVFHAAAYKHVPLLETQIRIAIRNNIMGTKIIVEAALRHRVARFMLISSDKAVNPTNIMGATKRAAELYCLSMQGISNTEFLIVRFGNVLGSVGSVVPLFKQQLAHDGPLTVTHPDITRYFMSIPEAARLILQAMAIGDDGDVYVLDMGEPIKILYLAEQMIRLSGRQPYRDINIEITGLRPGEKLHEELFYQKERLEMTEHKKIMKVRGQQQSMRPYKDAINELLRTCEAEGDEVTRQRLNKIIAGDWASSQKACVDSTSLAEEELSL